MLRIALHTYLFLVVIITMINAGGNGAVRVSQSLCSLNVHHTAFLRPPCYLRSVWWATEYSPVYTNGRSFGDAPLNDVLGITGGSTQKSAGKAVHASMHIRKSDQVVRRSSPCMLQPKVVPVVSDPPVPSAKTVNWGLRILSPLKSSPALVFCACYVWTLELLQASLSVCRYCV